MNNKYLLFCLLFFISFEIFSQTNTGNYSVLFYNVENLFDVTDDPETMDDEFTPQGDRRWTYFRLNKKLTDISKVILASAGWEPPQMIALCEIENRYVLERLLNDTPLKSFPYKIIHKDSPDSRGIDVAFLYNEQSFSPLKYQYFPLITNNNNVLKSREILYVSGIINNADTLHLFANHWPSRYSGVIESQSLRNLAAQTLKNQINVLFQKHRNPNIIIMGDFNDQPTDESLKDYLGAIEYTGEENADPLNIYNLSIPWVGQKTGTLKYQSQWSVFDQIIVSGSLLNVENEIFTHPEWAKIVQFPYLLEPDEKFGGTKIRRTYIGFQYNGGVSDHLPVLLQLQSNP